MLMGAVVCLCIIAVFPNSVQTNNQMSAYIIQNGMAHTEFPVDNDLNKRAFGRGRAGTIVEAVKAGYAVMRGFQAVRQLTKNAKLVYFTETYKIFKKAGGFRTALKDWQALKPQKVNVVSTKERVRMDGEVGDRIICLTESLQISETIIEISRIPNTNKEEAAKIEIQYTH